MTRNAFILLALAGVMLQVLTFGACRPRPRVEVFLSTGVVASVSDHDHLRGGAVHHHHDHADAQAATHHADPGHGEECDGRRSPAPDHVHLWDIGPVAPRPDRDADTAPTQPAPAFGLRWLDAVSAAPGPLSQRSVAPVAGAPPGLRTTRLLI